MRALVYRLSNGTVVRTLSEVKKSGLGYSVVYEEIVEPNPMSEKRKAILKANGAIR